jgi:hypothetical protein
MTQATSCRLCGAALGWTVVDLGVTPLCESFLPAERLDTPEPVYPLRVFLCPTCSLVQLPAHVSGRDIFREYAYFSSYSEAWLRHAERYAEAMIPRIGLHRASQVVEVASNDGYLLQYFLRHGIPSLGIEPAANVAQVAVARGIPTEVDFFGLDMARGLVARGIQADLLIGNNVLAQVPDLSDFVAGLAALLRPGGMLTLEFPHLLRLVEETQFDTIYHEHFSYFSLGTASAALAAHGLTVIDVEELPTHGGSLRLYATRAARGLSPSEAVRRIREAEMAARLDRPEGYAAFASRVVEVKSRLLEFLRTARREGKRVAGYGAPGKGNTLLNYCGIGTDLLEYTVDRNPYKQGKVLPGSRIPVFAPEHIDRTRPDYLLILPWNLKEEIMEQMRRVRDWGGRFVVPIPTLREFA